jgi:hypothetical protein
MQTSFRPDWLAMTAGLLVAGSLAAVAVLLLQLLDTIGLG